MEDLKDLANAGVINMDLGTFLTLNPQELQVQPWDAAAPLPREEQGCLRAEPNQITNSPLSHLQKCSLGSFSCSAAPSGKHLGLRG